jgi:hypothetical protein
MPSSHNFVDCPMLLKSVCGWGCQIKVMNMQGCKSPWARMRYSEGWSVCRLKPTAAHRLLIPLVANFIFFFFSGPFAGLSLA